MRIAIAGIGHETNTYCREQTPLDAFRPIRGERMLRARGTESSVGGALDRCAEHGVEPVPIMVTSTQPSGTIAADAYLAFKSEILEGLAQARPIDGVFLELHGAGVVDGISDLEGDLARAVRDTVGEAVPIAATFDLHGNVTQTMADALDGVFACHQYPHIDFHLRAREAIDLILRMLDDNFRPVSHVETLPILMPTTTTFEGIGQEVLAKVLELESEPGIIDVSWFHGFPYTDTEHVGTHIVVTTEGNREQAEAVAKTAAEYIWQRRESFRPRSLSAAQAVAEALSSDVHPVVINETSDNCGGGTPGDGTHLLKALLDAEVSSACFAFLVDPEVAEQAHRAGVGADITVNLGGKYDDLHGDTLHLDAYVKALHDGRLVMRAMMKGAPMHLGRMARLVVAGLDIVVASRRSQTFDVGPFLAVGIDVNDYDIVALKSSNHFRAGFKDIAKKIVTADPPGLTTHHVEIFERRNAPGPLWPIDDAASWSR